VIDIHIIGAQGEPKTDNQSGIAYGFPLTFHHFITARQQPEARSH
jgi:hypothetical protein